MNVTYTEEEKIFDLNGTFEMVLRKIKPGMVARH